MGVWGLRPQPAEPLGFFRSDFVAYRDSYQ